MFRRKGWSAVPNAAGSSGSCTREPTTGFSILEVNGDLEKPSGSRGQIQESETKETEPKKQRTQFQGLLCGKAEK